MMMMMSITAAQEWGRGSEQGFRWQTRTACYRESEASLSRPEVSRSGLWKGLSMNIECEVNPKCRRVLECLSINHNIVCEVNADVSVEVSLNEHRV